VSVLVDFDYKKVKL